MQEVRKDSSPKETVKKIKRILKENKIKVKELKVKHIYKKFYSIRLELKDFYNLGSNGKGLSKDLAKASAYAELMERLESRMLLNTYYLNKEKTFVTYYDETYKKFLRDKTILNTFFEKNVKINEFLDKNDKYHYGSKYKNLIDNKDEYLPSKLINATSFSNGLCAGNNYYEAVSQGICEIFERYCYKKILENEKPLTTITLDETLPIYTRIKYLEEQGFSIEIKNCTLSKYPVVGVYITNQEKDKYIFTLGCDPNINVAIQRCLTESFQGLTTDKQILNKMKPIENNYSSFTLSEKKSNWLKNYSSNNGIHPKKLFESEKNIHYKKFKCFNNLKTNKEIYNYLLEIISDNNHQIFLKDFSHLGFNTYKVFIPTLSNIDPISNNEKDIIKYYDLLKEIYFDLDNYNDYNNLKKASSIIEPIINNNKFQFIKLGSYFHSNNFIKTNYNDITFELLYVLINYKLNSKLKLNKLSNKKLSNYISSINSEDKYTYIIKDLNLKLPSCPNCTICKVKRTCKYKQFLKLNKTLKDKEKAFQKLK